eukprot:TRINITY_DN293_c0_g1_i5.p3 TRINITY_DN293_c0_g1~~TRINITY_DN293_c0_g1_i5.p3  ORF type:complete len:101 (+),score=22.72 TRINITY_DN293_c0_g1_i5:404-706(+)
MYDTRKILQCQGPLYCVIKPKPSVLPQSCLENAEFLAPGKIIAIRNGRVEVIRGNIRLEVDRWGKVTEETVSIPSVNNEKNISSIEYERVVRRQRNLKHK